MLSMEAASAGKRFSVTRERAAVAANLLKSTPQAKHV